jgi:hypothetical protein
VAAPIAIGGISISFLPSLFLGFSSFILRFGKPLAMRGCQCVILLCAVMLTYQHG